MAGKGENRVEKGVSEETSGALRRLLEFCLGSLLYWLSVCLAVVIFDLAYLSPAFWLLVAVYLSASVCYVLTLRKRASCRRFCLNKRWVALLILAVLPVGSYTVMSADSDCLSGYINTFPIVTRSASPIAYDEKSGVYSITAMGACFKILQLTDIHLGGSLYSKRKDMLALRACYRLIEYARPDLVIVTGDLCYPVGISSASFNNANPIRAFAAFMRNLGVPWAFAYGNHDTESVATMNAAETDAFFRSLSYKTSATLLYPYVQPAITGRNNQLIEVINADGTLRTALFLLDSGAYLGRGFQSYDYIRDDQVEWYADEVRRLQNREGDRVASLAFIHIPLVEYSTAYQLYRSGSPEVIYHHGENAEGNGGLISCSKHPSTLFERMVSLGSTTGVFCGHDHYNNISLTYRGIRLTYGMSIDYLVMPGIARETKQRGATMITVNVDSSWDAIQIPLTSLS